MPASSGRSPRTLPGWRVARTRIRGAGGLGGVEARSGSPGARRTSGGLGGVEARSGSPGARRTSGGLGGRPEPPKSRKSEDPVGTRGDRPALQLDQTLDAGLGEREQRLEAAPTE